MMPSNTEISNLGSLYLAKMAVQPLDKGIFRLQGDKMLTPLQHFSTKRKGDLRLVRWGRIKELSKRNRQAIREEKPQFDSYVRSGQCKV